LCIWRNQQNNVMKNLSFLAKLSIAATSAFAVTLLFSVPVIAAYSCAFLVLIIANDYAPRAKRWQPNPALREIHGAVPSSVHPLAA
jgi:hypothetical protein